MRPVESPSAPVFPLNPPRAQDFVGKTRDEVMAEMQRAIQIDKAFGEHCGFPRHRIKAQIEWRQEQYLEILKDLSTADNQ